MKNKVVITMMGMVLINLISLASAEVISIEPEILEPFSIYSGESITRDITIKTDGNYLVYLSWGVEGNSSNMEGFNVDYESFFRVNREKVIPITISADYNFLPDSFTINFNASTKKAEEASSNEYDETTGNIDTGIGLELEIESNGTGIVEVLKFTENPASGFGIPALNIFFQIEVSNEIEQGMNKTTLKVFYTDEEVNALGIDENNLRLYFYNETTGNWQIINSWVDTTNNIVYGVTTHFSLWGIFGEKDIPTIIHGGGRGTKIIEREITEYVNNTIEVEVLEEIEVIKNIEDIDKINELEKELKQRNILIGVISSLLIILMIIFSISMGKKRNEKVS